MANKFDELLEQFGSNAETLKETVLVDKRYLEEQKRKAKAFDEIMNIDDNYIKKHGFSPCAEEYAEDVENIIDRYMEDE